MEKELLLLTPNDISTYTNISGNLDLDRITPYIRLAQRVELKRILGIDLYNKIVEDYTNNNLSGLYEVIYNEFVKDILINYSSYFIIIFNAIRVDNKGNFTYEPENASSVDIEDTEKIASRYQKIGASIELEFIKWLCDNKIPERKDSGGCCNKNNTLKLNWVI